MTPPASDNNNITITTLLTPKSLALSLSAPRAPPHDSAHRKLLQGQDPGTAPLAHHHNDDDDDLEYRQRRGYTQRKLAEILHQSHRRHHKRTSHPHLERIPSFDNRITRHLGSYLPLSWLNATRDSGSFRFLFDNLVTLTTPMVAATNPRAAVEFIRLSQKCQRRSYGPHPMQVIDFILPDDDDDDSTTATTTTTTSHNDLLFFVHGGAWGSGLPWFYRLAASPFLQPPLSMAVAIVGYRTYPDADVNEQVMDLELAAKFIYQKYPSFCRSKTTTHQLPLRTCVMGHSSGAHIALLMIVNRAIRKRQGLDASAVASLSSSSTLDIDWFMGVSGPYSICHHFDFEAARGVEEFSPMKAACGHSRAEFRRNSPAMRLMDQGFHHHTNNNNNNNNNSKDECHLPSMQSCLPTMMGLLHGMEDDTVPFTATAEAARVLRSCGVTKCDEIYLPHVGHQEAITQIMLGGPTREAVTTWLHQQLMADGGDPTSVTNNVILRSNL